MLEDTWNPELGNKVNYLSQRLNYLQGIRHRPKIHPTPPSGSDVRLLSDLAKMGINLRREKLTR
jgi:hypothetical protein